MISIFPKIFFITNLFPSVHIYIGKFIDERNKVPLRQNAEEDFIMVRAEKDSIPSPSFL